MSAQHILLPYTGTPREKLLLPAVCALAKRRRARLTIACLVEVPLSLSADESALPGVAEANAALDEAEGIVSRSRVRVTTAVYPCRDAGRAVVALSARLGCSLIILEVGDRLSEGTSAPGPAVEYVVAHAPCEVWVSRIAQTE